MRTLYLVRGLPGSGKSTFAKTLSVTHVEADMFHVKDGVYNFDFTKAKTAHLWCQGIADTCLRENRSVVVSNTFTQIWEMRPYFQIASKHKAKIEIIQMKGDFGSIHSVPKETLDKMRDRWEWFPIGYFFPSEH